MRFALGLLILAGILLLGVWVARIDAPPSPPPTVPQPAARPSRHPQGGTFTLAAAEPTTLNPFLSMELAARRGVLRYTHDALMDRDPERGDLRPALATSVEPMPGGDGRRVRFRLRPDVRFADGTPLRDGDVLFGFHLKSQTELALGRIGSVLDLIQSAEVRDGFLELELTQVTATTVEQVATGYLIGQRSYFIEAIARSAAAAGVPAPSWGSPAFARWFREVRRPGPGTGPYQLAAWRPGDRAVLDRNPHSWARIARPGTWNLDQLQLRFVTEPTSQLLLARRGELDLYQGPDVMALARSDPDLRAGFRLLSYTHAQAGVFAIVWNHDRPALGQAAVRKHLDRLFDRERMSRVAFAGQAIPTRAWFPEDEPRLDPPETGPAPNIPPLELLFVAGQNSNRQLAEIAAADAASAGTTLRCVPVAWGSLLKRLAARDFDAALLYFSQELPRTPFRRFHSSQRGGSNFAGVADEALDRAVEGVRAAATASQRTLWLRRFAARFAEARPVSVLLRPRSTVLLRRTFRDAEPNGLGLYPERWWVPR